MYLALTAISVAIVCLAILVWWRRKNQRDRDEVERHSMTAQELHSLLASNQKLLVFDVRQPLDLLAYPQIIPGARRIPPKDIQENPSLIPKDEEAVVYCTCAGDKTSREILDRALALHFSRIKFLKGGLEAWKAKGYPVEPYRDIFHLYDPSLAADSR
jgi:rhodanese-related sulfurtransferase